jgi:hypothetical protein
MENSLRETKINKPGLVKKLDYLFYRIKVSCLIKNACNLIFSIIFSNRAVFINEADNKPTNWF